MYQECWEWLCLDASWLKSCVALVCCSAGARLQLQCGLVGAGCADVRAADRAAAVQQPQDGRPYGGDAAHCGRKLHHQVPTLPLATCQGKRAGVGDFVVCARLSEYLDL